ncbi:MAG: hypothetical protein AAGI17_00470 [Planctomycetota bacterium]
MPRLTLHAYAKVNLALSVGPAIPDGPDAGPDAGMHPISTFMSCVDVYDTIEIERTAEGADAPSEARVEVVGEGMQINWLVANDLTLRAVRLMEQEAGTNLPVSITVRKRIPAGGGLGGGSADAAAVIRGIDALFEMNLGQDKLRAIAAELGSDIPFFIDDGSEPTNEGTTETIEPGGAARPGVVDELGRRIRRVERSQAELILICPPFGCPTAEVYRAFDDAPTRGLRAGMVEETAKLKTINNSYLFNELEDAAFRVRPELKDLHASIREVLGGVHVHVSGSGSTLFVVGGGDEGIEARTKAIQDAAVDTRVIMTTLI